MNEPMPVLGLEGISKRYGGNLAVNNVSFTVPQSSIYAVIGPNGAGKSTLFGVIAGQYPADGGKILLNGRDVTKHKARTRAREGISRAFQVAHVFTSRTVEENVRVALLAARRQSHVFWASASQQVSPDDVAVLLDQVNLGGLKNRAAGELAQGDRKKLEIAMGLASHPTLLLLDEPTAGMTPEETVTVIDLVGSVQQSTGCSVLITEHDMKVVFGLAEQIVVLAGGAVLVQGTPEEIRNNGEVKAVYLGGR
ncbi:ABC transporter ATP-binding protein [Parafrigoribacterium mesophilum]